MQEEEEKEDDTIDRNGRNRAFRHTLSRHEESSSSVTTGINQDQITTRPKTSTLSLSTSVSLWRRAYNLLTWIPPSCRWDAEHPTQLTLPLNFLFGFAAMFTVANLYYNHPLLSLLAEDFHVNQEQVAVIPTVAQAGYASGLLFLCPLGDLVKRRPMVLILNLVTATLTLGICLTASLNVFVALQCLLSCTTVTPQLMLPLVGELAPPNRKATALSIVVSSMMLGMLIARLLSGIIANYSSWRNVYWMSFGLQYSILILLWAFMPDYPRANSNISYGRILWSIVEYLVRTPLLVQACLIGFFGSATFTSFWTTLTFLLSAATPYHYSTVIIGVFALAGIGPMAAGPFISRSIIDRFHPWISVLAGEIIVIVAIIISTATGTHTIAGPIIQAIFGDLGLQMSQIANRTAIFAIARNASNRVNTAYMLAAFCGQLTGTAVGNRLYARGGWVLSGSANIGFIGAAVLACLLRGPLEKGWVGWHGGLTWRELPKIQDESAADRNPETATATEDVVTAPTREGVEEEKKEEAEEADVAATGDRSSSSAASTADNGYANVRKEVDLEKGEARVLSPR